MVRTKTLAKLVLAAVLPISAGAALTFGIVSPAAAANATASWSATATLAVPELTGATTIGPLAASTPLGVTVGLALRDQSALDAFIASASTPSSSEFGEQYTTSSFAETFGPSATQVQSVTSYLDTQGFTDVQVTPNDLLVTATGTAALAEQAFDTSLTELRFDGADVYVNTRAAMVPSALSGTVVGVLGLNDVFRATPTPARAGRSTVTVPNAVDEYTPQGFQKAYEATGAPTGAHTAIATISSGAMTAPIANLRAEENANGLPQVPLTVEYAGLHTPATSTASVEWDLDSQFATGMAQEVSHFYFYDAATLTDSDLALDFDSWVTQDLAKAASASLGECEYDAYLDGSMVIDDEIFAEAAAQGQTMFASSGDTGGSCAVEGTNGVPGSGPPFVNYFASSPYVVAVGGTTLVTHATGSYDFEAAWEAGGGGLSQFEYRPYWQAEVMPVTDGKTGDRGVPDIAMDANPTTGADVYTTTGVEGVGGTSLSAPLALGTWARLESAYGNRIGYAAPVLYGVYQDGTCNTSTTSVERICTTPALHAPVAGDNGPYPETPGYNYDTGLGTFDTAAALTAVKPFVPATARPGPHGRGGSPGSGGGSRS